MVAWQASLSGFLATSLFESELTLMYAVLLALLLAGGVAIYAAYRWYRTLKEPPQSSEALDQLARALEQPGALDAEEAEKLRAALERGKAQLSPRPKTDAHDRPG